MGKKKMNVEKNSVVLVGQFVGIVKFIGKPMAPNSDWLAKQKDSEKIMRKWQSIKDTYFVGIKLGEGRGESNGTFLGVSYFETETSGATFVPVSEVSRVISPEQMLIKISDLNKMKKNNVAELSKLEDQLNIAKENVDSLNLGSSGPASNVRSDDDKQIQHFLQAETKKKWYISLQDCQYRYRNRDPQDVAALYKPHEHKFASMKPCAPHSRIVYTVAGSPRDNMVASGSDDKSIRLWRRIYDSYPGDPKQEEMRCIAELKLRSCINSLAFHPSQDILAAALDSGWIELYDLNTGKMMGALEGQSTSEVWTVCFSPNGDSILSGSLDRAIRVWSLNERECKWALRGHDEWVNGIAVSGDGKNIVSGSGDKTVRIWDTAQMKCSSILRGHKDFVRSVCVTSDNGRIVSASDDCTLRVWDLKGKANSEELFNIKAHNKGIYCVSAAPGPQNKVVSSSRDFSVRTWDVSGSSGKQLKEFKKHRGDVNSCCFFDKGSWVASCSDDKKVYAFKHD